MVVVKLCWRTWTARVHGSPPAWAKTGAAASRQIATVRARTWTWGFVSTAMSFFLEERFTSDTSCGPPLNGVTGEEWLSPVLRYQVRFEPVASRRREFLLFSIHTNGQRAGESAQRKLLALAVRFLRTGSARLSEAIGGLVSEGDTSEYAVTRARPRVGPRRWWKRAW